MMIDECNLYNLLASAKSGIEVKIAGYAIQIRERDIIVRDRHIGRHFDHADLIDAIRYFLEAIK